MSNIKEIYVGQRYSNLENNLTTLANFCTALSNKVLLESNLQHYPLTKEEYQTKVVKDLALYYEQEHIARKQNPQYNQQHQSPEETEAYFKRLQEYDLIELNEIKQQLESYIQKNCQFNAHRDTTFLDSPELNSRFTPKSLTTFGGLYKTIMYQLTPSIADYFSTGSHLFMPIINNGTYLGENPSFYHNDRLIAIVCTHEKYAVLYLDEEEWRHFKALDIPFELDD